MSYTFDPVSIMKDGKRIFPIMGEIHYSRVPQKYWEDVLLKMKAGGVTIVSAYVIWIHHEEIEGEYDWTGSRDLHAFVDALKKCGLKMVLRIGPWSHGEVRNGGFPDWLLKKDFEARTNDEKYFAVVDKWYKQIYQQVKDFINDPIIGVQIENEFGHCGGLYDESGEDHMKRLTKMAKDIGFDVPLYTATGWGGARTGGLLPVMGGYCDAPWDQRLTEIEPSGNYTFTHERNDHNIGSDHGFGYGITFDIKKFPYLTAELGGGLQVTSHRRTVATPQDIASVACVKLGSGVNLLGFYMYAGGTNPEGKLTTLQESRATGYLNDLPVKSYDFRAPVREFGQVNDTLRELKLFAYFAESFGEELCSLPAEIPQEVKPDDFETLRYSYRTDGKKGYLFVNNYVRHQTLKEHQKAELSLKSSGIKILPMDIKNGDYFFVPFGMAYGKSQVLHAEASPFTEAAGLKVFYGRKGVEQIQNSITFAEKKAEDKFLVLSRKDALNTWKVNGGKRLLITEGDGCAYDGCDGKIVITGREDCRIAVYPDFEKVPEGFEKCGTENKNIDTELEKVEFTLYRKEVKKLTGTVEFSSKNEGVYSFKLKDLTELIKKEKLSDCFVTLDYTGESALLYGKIDGERKLILDNFYTGDDYPWEIGLKRFADSKVDLDSLELEIKPLKKYSQNYIEKWTEINGSQTAVLRNITYKFEWRAEC